MGKYYFYQAAEEKDQEKVAQNRTHAIELLQRAADLKFANAEFFLGQCYLKGQGTEVNSKNAAKYCYRAAAKKNDIATIAKRYIKKNDLKRPLLSAIPAAAAIPATDENDDF